MSWFKKKQNDCEGTIWHIERSYSNAIIEYYDKYTGDLESIHIPKHSADSEIGEAIIELIESRDFDELKEFIKLIWPEV